MFVPKSHPIALNEVTIGLEGEARAHQIALMTQGMNERGRQKKFRDMILERPKNPYATRATETLAMAVEENPIQDHGRIGLMVSERTLLTGNTAICLPVDLPEGGRAGVYIYSDMSCTIALSAEVEGQVRALTLPFKLRTAQIRGQDPAHYVKVSARTTDRGGRYGVYLQEGKGRGGLIDVAKRPNHADFMTDLAVEIDAVLSQLELYAPVYQIRPVRIQESEKGFHGGLPLPVGPHLSTELGEELLGWLSRGGVSYFDVHLPFIELEADRIIAIRALAETAAKLAWARSGAAGTALSASLMVEAGNPISGDDVAFRIRQSTQDLLSDHRSALSDPRIAALLTGGEGPEAPRTTETQLQAFLYAFSDLFMGAIGDIGLNGYKYLYLQGQVGAWIPFILAEVRLNSLNTDQDPEALAALYGFQRKRLHGLRAH